MNRKLVFLLTALALVLVSLALGRRSHVVNPFDMPRPIDAADTLWTEEMTWMEVRDAVKAGFDTIIVPTGGIEQNGPYVATGKHNYIVKRAAQAIARSLGHTLVAPVVKFVPEGDIDPPNGHMEYAGTISLREDTFKRLLIDICASYKTHGFKNIILFGDSRGNQQPMAEVATELTKDWDAIGVRVFFIPEFYNYTELRSWIEKEFGIHEVFEGFHDEFVFTAQLLAIDPELVRTRERRQQGNFTINGVSLDPIERTVEIGRQIIDHRVETTVEAIKKHLERGN